MKVNYELSLWTIALLMGVAGFFIGQNLMYKDLYNDKIECKLTADEFIEDRFVEEK